MNTQEIEKSKCPSFESCSAALCPIDPHSRRYWFADTAICRRHGPKPEWISIQKKIQKVNPDPHSYYTQKMLESIQRISKDTAGISDCVGYNRTAEYEWIHGRENHYKNQSYEITTGDKPSISGENINVVKPDFPGNGQVA